MTNPTFPDPISPDAFTEPNENPEYKLWDSDTGVLHAETRRTLLQLLRGPYISAGRHSNLWARILVDEKIIRSRLADLYLVLVVDHEREVAFIRNVDDDAAPRVVRATKLTHIQSVLLLHLRQRLMQDSNQSRAIIDEAETVEQLSVFQGVGGSDPALFEKRVRAAWTRFEKLGILYETSTPGRYEISPVLAVIFGPEEIRAIRREYERIREAHLPLDDDDEHEEDDA